MTPADAEHIAKAIVEKLQQEFPGARALRGHDQRVRPLIEVHVNGSHAYSIRIETGPNWSLE